MTTHAGHVEFRSLQKMEDRRQMLEGAAGRAGKEGERDDAHRFLRVVSAVAVCHPGRAQQLQFAEEFVHDMRGVRTQQDDEEEHEQSAEDESGDRRA